MDILLEPITTVELQGSLDQGLQRARQLGRAVVVSHSEPASLSDPIDLFERSRQLAPTAFFWAQPGEDFALTSLDVAAEVEADDVSRFQQIAAGRRQLLAEAVVELADDVPGVGPIMLGGFSFDAQRPGTPLWAGFPHGRLVLPRLLYTRAEGRSWLTYNAVVTPGSEPEAEAARLVNLARQWLAPRPAGLNGRNGHARSKNGKPAAVTARALRPAAAWQADVAAAIHAIRHEELEKVVLARAVQLHAPQPFDAGQALRQLSTHYVGCSIFAVAQGERCFLGATPEQLVRLRDGEVRTMSLAGSIRRGKTAAEDDRLGQALLDSAKDIGEHAVVVRSMVEALSEACVDLRVSAEPALLKLGNIQHLCTPITGRLPDGVSLLDLVEALHPTPAVGGRPRDGALRLIRDCEKLDRGWYAGAVGWLDGQGEGEFAVAIRSALLHGEEATLFAGCGIMADSDPKREYAESELKLKPMLAALAGH